MKSFAAASVLALLAGDAHAFHAPLAGRGSTLSRSSSVSMMATSNDEPMTRRDAFAAFAAAAATGAAVVSASPLAAFAEEAAAPAAPGADEVPTDWGLTRQYYPDAIKMVRHMRFCTNMEKGTPNMAEYAGNCKKEMVEFVANYRRSNNISGKLSYSNLYTSISVLAGHYASYGPKFPVPEKRRKRLMQEYADIERAIKRQR